MNVDLYEIEECLYSSDRENKVLCEICAEDEPLAVWIDCVYDCGRVCEACGLDGNHSVEDEGDGYSEPCHTTNYP